MTYFPVKGEKIQLNHTVKSKERILVGLSWDEREDKVKKLDRFLKKDSQHDLDISCYIYDDKGEFIDYVGAEAQDSMDESGKIYHSGDDMTGAGDGDDEFINVELAELPPHVHGIVFMADIRSNHTFSDIASPFCRLADGMTDENLLETYMTDEAAGTHHAFVFCAVYRDHDEESETGWRLHNVSEYPDTETIDSWGEYLKQFVD